MDTNGYKVIKLMQFENQLLRLNRDVEKLVGIAAQHGAKIKELVQQVGNSVTQVEFMSAITTTRFQNLNVVNMKQDAKEDVPSANGNNSDSGAFNESRDNEIKQLKNQVSHLENELYQSNFKYSMDTKKMENEIKINRKEFYEMKNYLNAMEKKLEKFVQAVEEVGISTNITFTDPNKTKVQSVRKSSFLNVTDPNPSPPSASHGSILSVAKEDILEESEHDDESLNDIQELSTMRKTDVAVTVTPVKSKGFNFVQSPQSSTNPGSCKKAMSDKNNVADSLLSRGPSKLSKHQDAIATPDPILQTIDISESSNKGSMNPVPQKVWVKLPIEERSTDTPDILDDNKKVLTISTYHKTLTDDSQSTVPNALQEIVPVQVSPPLIHTNNGFTDSFDENDSPPLSSSGNKPISSFNNKESVENDVAKKIFFQRLPVNDVDIFDDYRRRVTMLFKSITAVQSVEDLSRNIASSVVTSGYNKIQDIIYGHFEKSLLSTHFRHSSHNPMLGQYDNNTNHELHQHANHEFRHNPRREQDNKDNGNIASSLSTKPSEYLKHTTTETKKFNSCPEPVDRKSTAVTENYAEPSFVQIKTEQLLMQEQQIHEEIQIQNADDDLRLSSQIENLDSPKEFMLNGMHNVDEVAHVMKHNQKVEEKKVLTVHLNKVEKIHDANAEVVDLNDSGDDFMTENMSQLEPLSLSGFNSISTDFRDLIISKRDEIMQLINKTFQKICVEMNKRMESIDEHTSVLSKNSNTLHHKYEKLQHQYNVIVCQFENIQKLQLGQAERVVDLANQQKLLIEPLTDSFEEEKQKVMKLELILHDILKEIMVIKRDHKKTIDEINKNNTKQGYLDNNMEATKRAHVETGSPEFEIADLHTKIRRYEKLFQDLHVQYEFVLDTLSVLMEDNSFKKPQLLPKSTREKVHLLVSSRQKALNSSIQQYRHGGKPKEVEQESTFIENTSTNGLSELQDQISVLRDMVYTCLNAANLSNQVCKEKAEEFALKSPMRNRKLVEFANESLESSASVVNNCKKKISPRAVPSLMNGKYLVHGSNHEICAVQEIELKLRAEASSRDTTTIQRTPMPPVISKGVSSTDPKANPFVLHGTQDENQYKSIWFHDFSPWHHTEES